MKQGYVIFINTILRIGLLAMLILTVAGAAPLFADKHDEENDYGEDGRTLDLFIEGDEADVGLNFGEGIPLLFSLGIGLGEGRNNSDASLLQGTPDLKNRCVASSEA